MASMPALPGADLPPEELAKDKGPGLVAGNIVVAVLAVVAVLLRLWCRRLKGLKLGIDDWLIVAALPFGLAMAVLTVVDVQFGLGKHMAAIPLKELKKEGQFFWVPELMWAISIPMVKISILVLYVRIFGSLRYIRWTAWALGVFTLAWGVAVLLVCAMQCIPIQAVWDKTVAGKCINAPVFFIAGSVPDVVVDFIVLALPIAAVWRLQKALAQRIGLIAIFAVGSLVCIISLVRLVQLIKNASPDVTWSLAQLSIWSTGEPCLGIVCACLPTMTPLLRKSKLMKSHVTNFRGRHAYDDYNRVHEGKYSDRSPGQSRKITFSGDGLDSTDSTNDSLRRVDTGKRSDSAVYALTAIDVSTHSRSESQF